MLESLDTIDWSAVSSHVYGDNDTIPARIRDLLSEDPRIGRNALEFLFGGGQDIGAIYASTAYIAPFMIEILADGQSPVCADILESLATVTWSKLRGGHYPIQELRAVLNTYDAVHCGLPVYLSFLYHDNEEYRARAAELLGRLSESAASILLVLRDRYVLESVTSVRIAIVEGMENLISSQDYISGTRLQREYAPFFQLIIESQDDIELQFAAVRAAIRTESIYRVSIRGDSNQITPLSRTVLTKYYLSFSDDYWNDYRREQIVELLALLSDPSELFALINHPDITPQQAHLIGRGLVAHSLHPIEQAIYWERYPAYFEENEGFIYRQFHISALVHKEFETQRKYRDIDSIFRILNAIVNADKFWEIPTNLFSSMFALPDEREKLARFIQEWG